MAIKIDKIFFMMTFSADADYYAELEGQQTYLRRASGSLVHTTSSIWKAVSLMGEAACEDLLEVTAMVKAHPKEYLEIESMGHGEHHSVLQDFLCSKWTTDQARLDYASSVYYPRKSIGYWLKNVGDQSAIDAYFAFKEIANLRLAEEYLRMNGVTDFVWT